MPNGRSERLRGFWAYRIRGNVVTSSVSGSWGAPDLPDCQCEIDTLRTSLESAYLGNQFMYESE